MKIMSSASIAVIFGLIFAVTSTTGFAEDKPEEKKPEEKKSDDKKEVKIPEMKVAVGDWCPEHGVPESICTRCSEKAAATAKEKGDWCKKHKRADTQCFLCHPDLKEKWLALKPNGGEKSDKDDEKKK